MSLADDFQAAVDRMNGASTTPGQAEQLKLYGLYKQATKGDPDSKRPGMTKIRERAKWDAWTTNKGTSKDEAMTKYMALVATLC